MLEAFVQNEKHETRFMGWKSLQNKTSTAILSDFETNIVPLYDDAVQQNLLYAQTCPREEG